MKISLNSIRGFNERYETTGDIAPDGVDVLVEKIGAQLGAVDETVDFGSKYDGVVIVKVVSCVQHPNADRLHVCTIDDGGATPDANRDENGHVQVVCGAPNVREGLTVAWLPPGSTVPDSFGKEPFVLEARELRGVVSNGMLASLKELALGDSHDGILEINDEVTPGTKFSDQYDLRGDVIIDIENKMFTHRPDCFGFLGVSRELAGIQSMAFKSPDWYVLQPEFPSVEADELPLEIKNELPELVPRFTAITMSNIQVGPSPLWLQIELAKVGQKSINNVVDYTNYFMLETGQPLHAYDYDKVKSLSGDTATIVVRNPRDSEKITLLNGKTIDPRQEAIMIATDKQLIGVGGVMGGSETEVDDNTKNIIIECANFDMYSVRRTSMANGLFSDAVTRFTKGQSPLQNLAVLARIVDEIRQFAGGKVASQVLDDNHLPDIILKRGSMYQPIPISPDFINARLGLELSPEQMKTLLENVEFHVGIEGDIISIASPFWRTDVETREDVVEEIGRLYGFDKLPLELPKRSIIPAKKDEPLELKNHVRNILARAGANEVLTYSFVHGDLLEKIGQDKSQAFSLSNALSPELQYYRLSITPSLLEKVHPNIKAGYDRFALFELGKSHKVDEFDDEGLPAELDVLALVVAANKKAAAEHYTGAAYYEARTFFMNLLASFGVTKDLIFVPLADVDLDTVKSYVQMVQPYEPTRTVAVLLNGQILGIIGEYRRSVQRALKLPEFCAGFGVLLQALPVAAHSQYVPLPRYPKVEHDITLKVAADLPYQELHGFMQQEVIKVQPAQTLPTLKLLDIYQKEDDANHKHVTFRLSIASYEKTMRDAEVSKLLDEVAGAAHDKLGAERL